MRLFSCSLRKSSPGRAVCGTGIGGTARVTAPSRTVISLAVGQLDEKAVTKLDPIAALCIIRHVPPGQGGRREAHVDTRVLESGVRGGWSCKVLAGPCSSSSGG